MTGFRKIILLGMPGSGKSTAGRLLAEHLSLPFIDLDEAIEQKLSMDIPTVFAVHGEEFFRASEAEVLKAILDLEQEFVMAVGGGTPCYEHNMEGMNAAAETIFLDISIDLITSRLLKSDISTRPLFKGLSNEQLETKLSAMYADRASFYRQAKFIVYDEASLFDLFNV